MTTPRNISQATTLATSPIAAAAQALAGLLRAAEEGGLPLPSSAEALGYTPSHHPVHSDYQRENTGGISLLVGNVDELTAWATWFDEPIDDSTVYRGSTHFRVPGWAGPVPVIVTAVVRQQAVAS